MKMGKKEKQDKARQIGIRGGHKIGGGLTKVFFQIGGKKKRNKVKHA